MSENLPTNDERRHPIPATPGGEQPAEGSNPEASTEERVAGCPAAPCSASSLSEALERASPSLLVDLSGMGLVRAELVQMYGLKLRGLRRRPDGLWEEAPWGNYTESPPEQ